jgi:hypothetical protein
MIGHFILNDMKQFNKGKIFLINKGIAEFMGAKILPFKFCGNDIMTWQECSMERMNGLDADANLSFHSSWDWLIPVVIKIEQMRYKSFPINVTISGSGGAHIAINQGNCAGEEYKGERVIADTMNLNYCITDEKMQYKPIELTWIAVAHFVEWYKKNKEK